MRTILTIFVVFAVGILVGCNGAAPTGELLTVDFQKGQTLRYKFVSSRDILVDWEPGKTSTKRSKDSATKSSESMEMVVAYKPVEVDPYGLTTVEATCESVKVKRSKQAHKDAVESLRGKSFMFTVNAAGKIEDYSQLDELVRELGKKAFDPSTKKGRIKNPDMISDFVAGQWFLWDSVSSIEKASEGVSPGQSWKSVLSLPTPMVMREARDVTYRLEEVRETEKGRIAVIHSSYLHAGRLEKIELLAKNKSGEPHTVTFLFENGKLRSSCTCGSDQPCVHRTALISGDISMLHDRSQKDELARVQKWAQQTEPVVPKSWPVPYTGRFQMRGRFGFLRRYKVLDLQGEGEELFNIEAGLIERYNQNYKMLLEASMPMGLNVSPQITIKQKLTMKLLED